MDPRMELNTGTQNGMGAHAAKPARIEAEIKILDRNIHVLSEAIAELYIRIKPILSPDKGESTPGDPAVEPLNLADRIKNESSQVANATRVVHEMIAKLEI